MFAGTGSARIAAGECSVTAASTASASFQGTITVVGGLRPR